MAWRAAAASSRSLGGYSALDFWRLKARLGPRKALGGLDYHRCVEFPYAANNLALQAGDGLLDAGSSHLVFGLFARATMEARVWVTDMSARVLQQREYPARLGHPEWLADGSFNVEQQDVTALSYETGFFHAVSCISTIEHVPDDGRAIQELARVLKPGGRLVLTVPFGPEHHEVHVAGELYGRNSGSARQFFQYVYDRRSIMERLLVPSGLSVLDQTVFSELGWNLSRHVYHAVYGRFLVLGRTLYPFVAERFMAPVTGQTLGPESICAVTLIKPSGATG